MNADVRIIKRVAFQGSGSRCADKTCVRLRVWILSKTSMCEIRSCLFVLGRLKRLGLPLWSLRTPAAVLD